MRSARVALPLLSLAIFAVVLIVGGIAWWTNDRAAITATPTPPPYQQIEPIRLGPGEEVCEDQVAFEPATRAVNVLTAEAVQDGPPLQLTARAGDWSASDDIDGGYGGYAQLQATLEPPPEPAIGEVCVRNAGERRTLLQGTIEGRIQTRSVTRLEGEPIEAKLALVLSEGEHRAIAERPGQILDRVAAFKPPIVGRWSLVLLGAIVVLGVPAAVIYAVARGIADEP